MSDQLSYTSIRNAFESCNCMQRHSLNLYGTVADFTNPRKSRGTDWFCVLRLVDASFPNIKGGLKVTLFDGNPDKLPKVKQWDIIRLHKLLPSYRKEDKSLISSRGWSWVLWKKEDYFSFGTVMCMRSITPSINDSDKEEITKIQNWLIQQNKHNINQQHEPVPNTSFFGIHRQQDFAGIKTNKCGKSIKSTTETQENNFQQEPLQVIYNNLKEIVEYHDNIRQLSTEQPVTKLFSCYGVVIDAIQSRKSKGRDYYCIARLIDPSYCENDGVKVTLYHYQADQLPKLKHRDILRLHNIKKHHSNHECYVSGKNFSWKCWERDESYEWGKNCATLSGKEETKIITNLVEWINSSPFEELSQSYSQNKFCTLGSMELDTPFTLNCQVLKMEAIDEELVILKVWDGTKLPQSFTKWEENVLKCSASPIKPNRSTAQVFVFDSSEERLKSIGIRSGSFVRLTNIYATTDTSSLHTRLPHTYTQAHSILVLYGGDVFSRNIQRLDRTDPCTAMLQSRMLSGTMSSPTSIIPDENIPTERSTLKQVVGFDMSGETDKCKLFRIRAKLYLAPRLRCMVFHHCPQTTFIAHVPGDGRVIQINSANNTAINKFREAYVLSDGTNKSRETSTIVMKQTFQDEDFSQWSLPTLHSSSGNVKVTVSVHTDEIHGSIWKTLTVLPSGGEGEAEVIRKKICRKSRTSFTIAYLNPHNFHDSKIRNKYDRCVRLSTFEELTSREIPPVVFQDNVFYYCSPATVKTVRVPTVEEEAETDEISNNLIFSPGRPIEALRCPLLEIVYKFRFLLRDESEANVKVDCSGRSALLFLNGVDPTAVISNTCMRQQVLETLHTISSGTVEDEKDEAVWCDLVINKCSNSSFNRRVVRRTSYNIERTKIST